MKHSVRNETSLVLVIAAIFSGLAIPVLSGFLEPSQPPAVAAVRIGDPAENDAAVAAEAESNERELARDRAGESQRERPAQPAAPAPADDDGAEDDGD